MAAAVGGFLLGANSAYATGFSLGAFDYYGLLVNNGDSGGDINTSPVDANVGIGNTTGSINLHNETLNGEVDCSGSCSSAVTGGNINGTQLVSGPVNSAGSPASVNSNVSAVGSAITAAQNLSSAYGAEAGSGAAVTINGTTTINASSGFLDTSGADVFTASSFSIGNGHTVTINGTASQYVVIDVTGSSGNKLDGAVTLTGGITPDHVLINFLGSGSNLQGAANGATINATILAPNLGIQLDSLTIDGHLFGGEAETNFQFVSNALINQPPLTTTPLPAALPMFSAGLAVMGLIRYRRKQRSSFLPA